MRRILFLITMLCNTVCFVNACEDKTEALHQEAKNNDNPNIIHETHPVLFEMVKSLVERMGVAMPRYITLTSAQHSVVNQDTGRVNNATDDIVAWVDILGDLYVHAEIASRLPYDKVEGAVAIALAEKAINKPATLALTGVGTYAATIAAIYWCNKHYNLKLGSLFSHEADYSYYRHRDRHDAITGLIYLTFIPAVLSVIATSNNLQKKIDINAAKFTNAEQIIESIKAIKKLQETYKKEGFLSRVADAMNLKGIYNFLFYPVRSYTDEERIAYLERLKTV